MSEIPELYCSCFGMVMPKSDDDDYFSHLEVSSHQYFLHLNNATLIGSFWGVPGRWFTQCLTFWTKAPFIS